ncbi:MAG: hypothetical protein HKN30_09745 [Sulfitobacter sp.]|nr:hypothetical protein [Sulfitobacter sp.]
MRRTRDRLATFNERVKLLAGFFNTIGLGFVGFAFIRLLVDGTIAFDPVLVAFTMTGVAMHAMAHYILRYLEFEVHDDAI